MKHQVLIVDDDDVYAQFIISEVAKSSLEIKLLRVASTEEALNYLRRQGHCCAEAAYPMPEVVLLDVNLSGKSGYKVLRWLRDNGHLKGQKVSVVMLTSSEQSEDVRNALELGASSYLVKSPWAGSVLNVLAKVWPEAGRALSGDHGVNTYS